MGWAKSWTILPAGLPEKRTIISYPVGGAGGRATARRSGTTSLTSRARKVSMHGGEDVVDRHVLASDKALVRAEGNACAVDHREAVRGQKRLHLIRFQETTPVMRPLGHKVQALP